MTIRLFKGEFLSFNVKKNYDEFYKNKLFSQIKKLYK